MSDPVILPELTGEELPARKAIAWAMANTGKPKIEIQGDIERILRNLRKAWHTPHQEVPNI